jgi:hypothetical protein
MKKILDVIALGGAMIGSALISTNTGYVVFGFCFFLVSSVASTLLLLKSDASKALLLTNLWFIGMNIVGIWRH